MNKFILSLIILLSFSSVSAFDFPHTIVNIDYAGNLTNLSEMQDVNIPSPSDNQLLQFDSATNKWIAGSSSGFIDTNASTACSGTDYLAGNGSCLPAVGGGSGDITAVNTNGKYLTGGATSGNVNLLFNETVLNATIDSRGGGSYTNGTGLSLVGNTFSVVLSYFQGLFLQLSGGTMTGDLNLDGFTNGSILFIDQDGRITQNNSKLFFEDGNLAVGDNSHMNNAFQVIKNEGITNIDTIKALIVARNTDTTNDNWAGFSMQTNDLNGNTYSGARILTHFTNHSIGNVSGDLVIDTRHLGIRSEKMRLNSEGDLNVVGTINATSYTGDGSLLTGIVSGLWTNSSGNATYVDGNVGIGTTTPSAELEVVGDIVSKGTKWTARESAVEGNNWYSVTYGNGLFVAVSNTGTNRVMTSPDGITWTARTSANETNNWRSVTYGNGLFVAVSYDGTNRVMTSPNGTTWTARTSANETNGWSSVTYGNGLFVAVSASGTNRVMTSPDGITWTPRLSANESNMWISVTYGNGLFVAVSYDGTNRVMTSPDGITWTERVSSNETNNWRSVIYGNGLFVAVSTSGTNRVMTSPDGITWTPRLSADESNTWISATYGNGVFVVTAICGTNRVMTSGKSEMNIVSHNNFYQGGMSIYGDVGIGTTAPDRLLTLSKVGQSEDTYLKIIAGQSKHAIIELYADEGDDKADKWRIEATGTGLGFKEDEYGARYISLSTDTEVIINDDGQDDVDFRVESDTDTHALFLDATNGNFGINTSTPLHKLHVVGTVNATSYVGDGSQLTGISGGGSPVGTDGAIQYNDGGSFGGNTSILYVNETSGFLGIGTATPSGLIDISDGNSRMSLTNTDDSGQRTILNLYDDQGGKRTYFSISRLWNTASLYTMANKFEFWTDGFNRMALSSTGLALSSGLKFGGEQVNAINGYGLKLYDDDSNGIFIEDGGDVGINTLTPSHKLNVVGDANVTGILYVSGQQMTVPDYVFEEDYNLMPIEYVEFYTKRMKHLPNILSANETEQVNVVLQQQGLLKKIEELFLYVFDMNDEIKNLQAENNLMKEDLCSLGIERWC